VFIPLPPIAPQPSLDLPVRFLLVGAEPSDRWRRETPDSKGKSPTSDPDALRRINDGYRNYSGNLRTIALDCFGAPNYGCALVNGKWRCRDHHYSIEQFDRLPGETPFRDAIAAALEQARTEAPKGYLVQEKT